MFPGQGRFRWLWRAVTLLFIVLVSAVFLKTLSTRREVRVELSQIRGRGEPTDLRELDNYYKLPATERDGTKLTIERFRNRHGHLPDRLDLLVPDLLPRVPIDPFDAKPLRYSSTVDRYLIYSVGANQVDDSAIDKDQLDYVFRVQFRR